METADTKRGTLTVTRRETIPMISVLFLLWVAMFNASARSFAQDAGAISPTTGTSLKPLRLCGEQSGLERPIAQEEICRRRDRE
jgi:hypothetical protein